MARRKVDSLRDAVIAAARDWQACTGLNPLSPEAVREMFNALSALDNAVRALNEYLDPIVDTPGEYVEGSPETSRDSAVAFTPLSGKVRRGIVNEVYSVHRYESIGLTCSELMARLRESHQTISGAISFLGDAGWTRDSGLRRLAPSKRPQIVWELTPAALAFMRSAGG